jgi:hypothetical protein
VGRDALDENSQEPERSRALDAFKIKEDAMRNLALTEAARGVQMRSRPWSRDRKT